MADLLLVDDSDDFAEVLGLLLTAEGHTLRRARDGIEGLKLLDKAFPQLVITDIDMPVLDGPAMICRMFVEDLGRENIPVILVSGDPRLKEVASVVGTPYCVAKPFAMPVLSAMIERALEEALPPTPPM